MSKSTAEERPFLTMCVLVGLIGVFLAALMANMNAGYVPESARMQLVVAGVSNAIGLYVLVVAAVLLLFQAMNGAAFEQMTRCSLALLGGALVVDRHWAVALAIGAFFIAAAVVRLTRGNRTEQPLRHDLPTTA